MSDDLERIERRLERFDEKLDKMMDQFRIAAEQISSTKAEMKPVRMLVYGLTALVLSAVFAALIKLVLLKN